MQRAAHPNFGARSRGRQWQRWPRSRGGRLKNDGPIVNNTRNSILTVFKGYNNNENLVNKQLDRRNAVYYLVIFLPENTHAVDSRCISYALCDPTFIPVHYYYYYYYVRLRRRSTNNIQYICLYIYLRDGGQWSTKYSFIRTLRITPSDFTISWKYRQHKKRAQIFNDKAEKKNFDRRIRPNRRAHVVGTRRKSAVARARVQYMTLRMNRTEEI